MASTGTSKPRTAATRRRSKTLGEAARTPLPPVDERLIAPESRYEVFDGNVEYVVPADEPHGIQHAKIAAVLGAYAADGYDVAVDMLTRTSEMEDMAPDASVFPSARDEATGGRRLEELAFEVLSTERSLLAAKKAHALTARGVRRVFAVDVEHRRALVWSTVTNTWEILPGDGAIEDRALALPLPIAALVDPGRADDAVATALLARKNPVIEQALRAEAARMEARGEVRAEKRGAIRGKQEALIVILSARGFKVGKKATARIRAVDDEATLEAWLLRAVTAADLDGVLGR